VGQGKGGEKSRRTTSADQKTAGRFLATDLGTGRKKTGGRTTMKGGGGFDQRIETGSRQKKGTKSRGGEGIRQKTKRDGKGGEIS